MPTIHKNSPTRCALIVDEQANRSDYGDFAKSAGETGHLTDIFELPPLPGKTDSLGASVESSTLGGELTAWKRRAPIEGLVLS
jgi:hypothetical protein